MHLGKYNIISMLHELLLSYRVMSPHKASKKILLINLPGKLFVNADLELF